MSSPSSARHNARKRFLLITIVSITTSVIILSVGLFFMTVPLSGYHHNDCVAAHCRAFIKQQYCNSITCSSSSNTVEELFIEYQIMKGNSSRTVQVLYDSEDDDNFPCIVHQNPSITNNTNTSLIISYKGSHDDNYSTTTTTISFHNITYTISTNTTTLSSIMMPCYYNNVNSFFFAMTFSLPQEHDQLELILGGVMILFIVLVVGCLCCLPLSMAWICLKEEILQRKQNLDFHNLDSTWDE